VAEPAIYLPDYGRHNLDFEKSAARIKKGAAYKDCSTVIVTPTRGMISARVVYAFNALIRPMNQRVVWLFAEGMEVGEAYNNILETILNHPELSNSKYLLTVEDDNLPPQDGLLRLYESMELGYDIVGGLYWTRGEGGAPLIFGDPKVMPKSFFPQVPKPNTVQPCNGLGMGFTLFKLDMFKDERIEKPFFKTVQDYIPGQGSRVCTQDFYFLDKAAMAGYRFAVDTRVRVGHLDVKTGIVW
jgi:hypothetical protein